MTISQITDKTPLDLSSIDLNEVIEEIFMVLTQKERDVIRQRFSLDNEPRRTLENIGRKFSVTRERIRQIEKIALGKLRRTAQATSLAVVNELANSILERNGGLLIESKLISEILNSIKSENQVDGHIIRLALSINQSVRTSEKTNVYHPFWRFAKIDMGLINDVASTGFKILKKRSDVANIYKLGAQVVQTMNQKSGVNENLAISALEIDKRVKRVDDTFGLMSWRHINPRSIRDKAYIILKKEKRPMHFVEIANSIISSGFDRKVVTIQAVHNELIRYDQFVLVGRGLYALKEFGYEKGTVADIIIRLLEQKSPMSKQEIIEGVLKQRYVKKGTISLNLQKNPRFLRVGRAVYSLDK